MNNTQTLISLGNGNGELVPTREPDITRQVNTQEKLLYELSEYLQQLEQRLALVIREPGPAGIGEEESKEMIVPLAARIRQNNEQIMKCIAGVNGIIQRLEI